MKKKIFLFVLCYALMTYAASAQGLYVGVEFGMNGYGAPLQNQSLYRTTIPLSNDYYMGYDAQIRPIAWQPSIGLKIEKPFFNNRLSIASGVFYTSLVTYTHWQDFLFGDSFFDNDRFYILVEASDENLVYLSAYGASAQTSYVGIPLDCRFELAQGRSVGFYVKFGALFNFRLNSSVHIRRDDGLSLREEYLLQQHFENAKDLFVSGTGSLGLRFGRPSRTNFRMEMGVPFAFTPNVGCHRITAGFGMKFSVMVPILFNSKAE